jgi:hypothetical protein
MGTRHGQQGITAIGFIMIAAMVGLIGYGALRLFPVYQTQFKIAKLMSDLKSEYDGNDPNPTRLAAAIEKRLDIESVDYPSRKDFTITKTDEGYLVKVSYEDQVPYIANISLLAAFENSAEIAR